MPTPPFSAEGTRRDAVGNLHKGEMFAMCLQQVAPKGVWLCFHDVERILDMNTGEIQAMCSDIRPKEHGRTRQKPSLTEVQEKLQYMGVYFLGGYLAVVDSWGLRPEWRGWRYLKVGKAVLFVNTSPGNATTGGLDAFKRSVPKLCMAVPNTSYHID